MEALALINNLIRNRNEFISRSLNQRLSLKENLTLLTFSVLFYSVYGLIIGASHSMLQAGISGLKLPCLFLITTLICFPALYFFLTILGIRQSGGQLISFMFYCLTIMSIVLFVLAPVSLFFLITSHDYLFFKLLNIAIFSVAGFVGLFSFYKNILAVIKNIPEGVNRRRAIVFLILWLMMFAFVGCQLSYTLSPFFGYPNEPFVLFTNAQSNFQLDVLETLTTITNR